MKKIILISIHILLPLLLSAQPLSHGAQCGAHASGGCEHYQTFCQEEYDALILLSLHTDAEGAETSWEIEDMTINQIVGQGDNLANNTLYQTPVCAQIDHCYQFRIQDSGGNGIHPGQGGYTLYINGQEMTRGGVFEAEETVDLLACCSLFEVYLIGGTPCDEYYADQVTAYSAGGVAPFYFTWSTGATATAVAYPGSADFPITVEVEDAAGCLATDTLEAGEMTPLEVTIRKTDLTGIGVPDGTAEVHILHGIPPFRYFWSNGETTQAVTGLSAGAYQVTVLDATECMTVAQTNILTKLNEIEAFRPQLQIFPNPSTQEIQVVIEWDRPPAQGFLRLCQTNGVEVFAQKLELQPGDNRITLAPAHLPPGLYRLSLETEHGVVSRAVVRF